MTDEWSENVMVLKVCGDTFKSLWRSGLIQVAIFGTVLILVIGGFFSGKADTLISSYSFNVSSKGAQVSNNILLWQNQIMFNGALFPFAEGMYFVVGVILSFDILRIFRDNNSELMMASRLPLWKWFLGKIIAYYCVCMVIGYIEVWTWNFALARDKVFDVAWSEFFTPYFIFNQIRLFIILGTPGFFYYASLTIMGAMVSGSPVVGLLVSTAMNFLYLNGPAWFPEILSWEQRFFYPAFSYTCHFYPPEGLKNFYEGTYSPLDHAMETLGIWIAIIIVGFAISYIAARIRLDGGIRLGFLKRRIDERR